MNAGETHREAPRYAIGPPGWRLAALIGHTLLACLTLTLAQSILWSPDAGWILKGLTIGIGVLSFWTPKIGLFVVATITPLSLVLTRALDADPVRTGEALVLAFLAGFVFHSLYSMADVYQSLVNPASTWPKLPQQTLPSEVHRQEKSSARPWLLALAIVAIGSCVAQLAMQQLWQNYPLLFAEQVLRYLAFGYHGPVGDLRLWVRPASFEYIAVTVLFVTGIMLAISTERLVRQDRTITRALAAALVFGGVIAGLSSFVLSPDGVAQGNSSGALMNARGELIGINTRNLFAVLTSEVRWAGFTGKVSSAGSLLVLIIGVALGGLGSRTRFAPFWLVSAGITIAALLLTGSRSAILAAAVVSIGVLVYRTRQSITQRGLLRHWVALCVTVAIGAVMLLRWEALVNYLPTALGHRWGLTVTSLRMFQIEPLFGLGISQFYPLSEQFSSAELMTNFVNTTSQGGRTNAHNTFLQIATELGLVGLVPFLMSLFIPLRSSWARIRSRSENLLLLGTFAGVVCFLTTCLTGQPLLIAISAYPFWITFGFLAALSSADTTTNKDTTNWAPWQTVNHRVSPYILVATLLIVATLTVIRVSKERSDIDLSRIDYGLYNWETDGMGVNYRWSGRDATLFLAADIDQVNVPLRAAAGFSGHSATVTIVADGQPVDTVVLTDDAWSQVAVPLQVSDNREVHRLEFSVSPTWRPSEINPNSRDKRLLGVMVGEISGRGTTGRRSLVIRPDD